MIRQARNYFVGAFSGVTLIGIAIGVFVLLVSAQVFHNFPLELSGHTDPQAVAPAKALPGSDQTADRVTAGTGGAAAPTGPKATATATTTNAKPHRHHAAQKSGTSPAIVADAGLGPSAGSDESAAGGTGGSNSSPSSTGESGSSGSSSGGSSNSSSSSSGSNTATGSSGSGSSSGGGSSSSGGSTTSTPPTTATVKKPVAETVEAVNNTVGTVDEKVLGGTLEKTGVKQVTEEVVNNVAGPESVVGKTVEGVTEVVGGLLGGGSH